MWFTTGLGRSKDWWRRAGGGGCLLGVPCHEDDCLLASTVTGYRVSIVGSRFGGFRPQGSEFGAEGFRI